MSTEVEVQEVVYKLEEGKWKKWVLLAVLIFGTIGQLTLWFYTNNGFKGLANPRAMEQAEIARELARGHGFSTKIIRPAAFEMITKNTGSFPLDRSPDIYHAPLWPAFLTPVLWAARDSWEMSPKTPVYVCDKFVAFSAFLFFVLGVIMTYFLVKRLFDQRLALFVVCFTLLCDRFWQYAMSGLPQMLLFFLFSCAAYTLLRAVEAHCAANPIEHGDGHDGEHEETYSHHVAPDAGKGPQLSRVTWLKTPVPWLLATALLFGLMALGHGLTLWIFLGVLAFCLRFFGQKRLIAMMAGVVLLMYAPWLYRNYQVCGGWNGIGGLAPYTAFSEIRGSESAIMRSMDPLLSGAGVRAFPAKILKQSYDQWGSFLKYFGFVIVTPMFFMALLHTFKRREIAVFRWGVLLMWLTALLGMSLFGIDSEEFPSNDLHLLFIPLFAAYGMAYVLYVWTRLDVSYIRLVNYGFIALLFLISDRPFIGNCLGMAFGPPERPWHWPPYFPPGAAVLRTITTEKEILMTDIPEAVAWYGDREALWLPMKIDDFNELNDYNKLKHPVVGLYLTPRSGDEPFIHGLQKGDYKEWWTYIVRLQSAPFRAKTSLPPDNECIVYFDRDRWSPRED